MSVLITVYCSFRCETINIYRTNSINSHTTPQKGINRSANCQNGIHWKQSSLANRLWLSKRRQERRRRSKGDDQGSKEEKAQGSRYQAKKERGKAYSNNEKVSERSKGSKATMEGLIQRLDYPQEGRVPDAEVEVAQTVRLTLSQGLDNENVLSFRLPADPDHFTDLNTILLKLEISLVHPNGNPIVTDANNANGDPEDFVCMDAGGMHSLFKSCDIFLNDESVSTMTAYPYTATLTRLLGMGDVNRDMWETFDATYDWNRNKSDMTSANVPTLLPMRRNRVANKAIVIGRIYSDLLMSCRQFLPPGVSLGIDLRRAPDSFSLLTNVTQQGANNIPFRVNISYASLYVKRLKLRPALMAHLLPTLKGACTLTFNRLECRAMSIPVGSSDYRWLNCLNNAPLPNRLYVAFVAQKSMLGSITQGSTYLENLNLSKLGFKLNGRDLQVEPISCNVVKVNGELITAGTDLTEGYMSVMEVLNHIDDTLAPKRLGYYSYVRGNTVFALELGKCGEKSGTSGSLDLEVCLS